MQNEQFNAPKIDINQLAWVSCSCGGKIFDSGVMVKRLSPLMSPTGKEEILPAEIIICKSCGKIPDFYANKIESIPEDLISKTPDMNG
jgi:hypothetical protein